MGSNGGVFGMFGQAAQHLQQQPHRQSSDPSSSTSAAQQPFDWSIDPTPNRELDLVFIMDCTGSMSSYINAATKNIETISEHIIASERLSAPGALRIGLVAFRDHPPQDYSYITRNFGFMTDVAAVKDKLKDLYASGGGDGPEAITAALKSAVDMEWRPTATRLAVLVTDAPPHGIGEYGDGFPRGSPDGQDPIKLARQMAQMGISLFMVACEPALSSYSYAVDLYQAIVRVTSGLLVPLTSANLLAQVIIASASEAIALDRLHREIGDEVLERLRSLSLEAQAASEAGADVRPNDIMDSVARDLHQRLLLRNESTKQLVIESIYRESEESKANVEIWATASDVPSAQPHIQKVYGSRLSDKYLATRQANTRLNTYGAPFPGSRSSLSGSPSMASGSTVGSSWSTLGATTPSSPPRKVVSSFSAFSASPGMSMSGASASPTFGGNANISGFGTRTRTPSGRGMLMDDDDDDDDDDDGVRSNKNRTLPLTIDEDDNPNSNNHTNRVDASASHEGETGADGSRLMFKQGAISLDQARRLAVQTAWRGGLA